jgi:arylsulfatase
VPFVVSWPNGGLGAGGAVREQFVHVSDLLPTFLELAGVDRPDTWHGRPVLPLYGESVAATLRDPDAPGRTADLVVENEGHRGFRRGRWEAVTRHVPRTAFSEEHWELYDALADPTQLHDLAAQQPQLLGELIAAWEEAAWSNQIFPLDEGTGYRYLLRPSWTEVFDRPVVLRAGTPTLDRWRSQRLILWRDVDVEAHVHLREGDAGVLVAHGDQGGGYSLYVDRTGELVAAHNGYGLERSVRGPVVEPGEHRLALHIRCPGQDRWDLSLSVDGEVVAAEEGFRLLMAMAPFEGIDVGLDRRSPVCWDVYERHGPFPFTGTIESVAYSPGTPAPDSPVDLVGFLRDWGRRFE